MRKVLILTAFLTGFSAIALEVLWTRVMVMVVGGSTYAFTVVLVSFLLGIALGSLAIAFSSRMLTNFKRIQTNERMLLLCFAIVQILLGASVIFTIPALGDLPFGFLELFKNNTPSFFSLQFLQVLMVGKIIILPTIMMGISLPLLINANRMRIEIVRIDANKNISMHSQNSNSDGISISVGKIYAANTFGGVLGALLAGFVLIPLVGVQKGILGMGIVYLLVGTLMLIQANYKRMNANERIKIALQFAVIISVTAIVIIIGLKFPSWDQQLLSSGFYKDPSLYAGADKARIIKKLKSAEILYEKEGISAHVAVTQGLDGVLSLKINGKADASTGSDMENQLLLGHLPMLLHPSSDGLKEVLVVGLGSGITLGSILSHNPKAVDAIEIEEKVVEAARFFNKYSNNALDDPRVRIIVGDGRNFLLAKSQIPNPKSQINSKSQNQKIKYDVITSEPSNPWLSGSSKLFTKEYFELYKNSIKDDGVVIHWINLHSIDQESLKRVFRAYLDVFSHVAGFGVPASNDLLLVGANKPIAFDFPHLTLSLRERAGVRGDLAKVGIKDPFEILAYFVMGEKEIKKLVGNTPANTDNYPYVEFHAPKFLYTSVVTNPWRVIYENLAPIQAILGVHPRGVPQAQHHLGGGGREDSALISQQSALISASEEFRRARLLTQVYSVEKNIGEGIKEGEKALKIDPDNLFIKETLAKFYFEEGTSFFNQSVYGKAISSLSKSLELKKTAEAYFNLGQTYGWDGDLEKARENYELAVKLDPEFEQGWMWLGDTASQLGDLNDAISSYQKVVRINPKSVEAHVSLGNLYILRKDFGRARKYLDKVLELDPANEKAEELRETIP